MSRTARVAAYQSRYIGTVFLVDPTKSWKLHTNFKFTTKKAVPKPMAEAVEAGPARDRVQAPAMPRPVVASDAVALSVKTPGVPRQQLPAGKRAEYAEVACVFPQHLMVFFDVGSNWRQV
jgi:hypothetical protein